MTDPSRRYTAFAGPRRLSSGGLDEVAVAVLRALEKNPDASVLVFSDDTGKPVDLDLRGTPAQVAARYAAVPDDAAADAAPRGRGRPRLGVVAREVTLLPEHWEWLAAQPGGASVALRKLVHQARKASAGQVDLRRVHERTYAFMSAMAGNRPGFEEAARALFADDASKLARLIAKWPKDLREHVARLADPGRRTPAGE